jgi:hypothetical protein
VPIGRAGSETAEPGYGSAPKIPKYVVALPRQLGNTVGAVHWRAVCLAKLPQCLVRS